jgi:pyridoxamine 5'-phosphate oxidase
LVPIRRARSCGDPCADRCFLATVSAEGGPTVRTLVLRGLEAGRVEVHFNATSAKWRELRANRRYELLVFWSSIQRQYRVRGDFDEIPFPEIARHWEQKSAVGKLLDLYYAGGKPQGSPLKNYQEMENALEAMRVRVEDAATLDPPRSLMGLRLKPERIDLLDLENERGLQARYLFVRSKDGWNRRVLVP